MFKLLRKGTKSDFYIIVGIFLLCLFRTTLSLYLDLDTYQQMGLNALISVLILVIVLITLKNKIKNQQELKDKENLLNGLLQESRMTLNKIISTTQDAQIKEPAMQLSETINNMKVFNNVKNEGDYQPEQLLKKSKVNKNLRKGIVAILVLLMIGSLIIYTGMVVELAESKMNRAIDAYDTEPDNKILGNDSYLFTVDDKGYISNHPNSEYNTFIIKDTEYWEPYLKGVPTFITDYTDSWCVCLSKKNPNTGYTIVVVVDWWAIYGSNLLLGIILFLIFLLCVIIVDLFIDRLFDWQDSVNKQLEKAIDDAIAAGKAKSQFFAQMSHEIRTPINAVIGMNEMILRECRDKTIIKYANNAYAAAQSLLSLINDILDFSKLESDKMELVEEVYQLDELIRTLVTMVKFRAEKKNLDFKVKVNENIPNELFGDSTRIRQIIVNFLTNAVKYTKVGGIVLSVDMELGLDEDTGVKRELGELLLTFSVKDSGIGIRDEDKSKLFKNFERFDAKTNKNVEGTGLGLAITAKLVKMMRGKIDVQSVYGEGSTFTVLLPQKVMGKKAIGKFEEKIIAEKPKTNTYRVSFVAPNAKILVVDDNEMNLLVATSLLKATKIQVDTAINGKLALNMMAKNRYDLVFLDQMMPELDGIETLKLAKDMKENKSPGIPMIALTANAVAGAREMFLKEGFTNYLSKPIDAVALENMLMEYLPADKLQKPPKDNSEFGMRNSELMQNIQYEQDNKANQVSYKYLDVNLGLQYSSGMEDMYKEILTMFCKLKDEKKTKIQEAFDKEDWQNYTTFVHALKSTSLSVGGTQLSEAAKQLEMSGKVCISEDSTELDKHLNVAYIQEHHAETMELYDKLVEEGRDYLNSEFGIRNAELENNEVEKTAEESSEQNNSDYLKDLQEAFDEENWVMYSILLQEVKSDNPVFKQIDMACKMINADFTTDQEKQEAINYIKENHSKLLEKI